MSDNILIALAPLIIIPAAVVVILCAILICRYVYSIITGKDIEKGDWF